MSAHTTMHLIIDGADPYEDVGVHVTAEPKSTRVSVDIDFDFSQFSITGDGGAVLTVLARAFQYLKEQTDQMGEECSICGKRGVNRGKFPQSVGFDHYVHLGCAQDEEHDRTRHMEVVR